MKKIKNNKMMPMAGSWSATSHSRQRLPSFDPGVRGGSQYRGMDRAFPALPVEKWVSFPSPNLLATAAHISYLNTDYI